MSTLASVRRQSLSAFECVIVDDGSTDASAAIARKVADRDSRFVLLSAQHGGIVSALNRGLEVCRAPLIVRMDADDWMHPRRLELQASALDDNPGWSGVGCHVQLFPLSALQAGRVAYESWLNSLSAPAEVARDAYVECPIAHPTLALRSSVFQSLGYRDQGWPEDYDLVLRLIEQHHDLGVVTRKLLWWRDHPGRLSRANDTYSQPRFVACKAHYLSRSLLAGHAHYLLWGYGKTGKQLCRALVDLGHRPAAIVELHPGRIGQKIHGAPVIPPDALGDRSRRPAHARLPLIISVAREGPRGEARRIARSLGLEEGRHFACAA